MNIGKAYWYLRRAWSTDAVSFFVMTILVLLIYAGVAWGLLKYRGQVYLLRAENAYLIDRLNQAQARLQWANAQQCPADAAPQSAPPVRWMMLDRAEGRR